MSDHAMLFYSKLTMTIEADISKWTHSISLFEVSHGLVLCSNMRGHDIYSESDSMFDHTQYSSWTLLITLLSTSSYILSITIYIPQFQPLKKLQLEEFNSLWL